MIVDDSDNDRRLSKDSDCVAIEHKSSKLAKKSRSRSRERSKSKKKKERRRSREESKSSKKRKNSEERRAREREDEERRIKRKRDREREVEKVEYLPNQIFNFIVGTGTRSGAQTTRARRS